MKDQFDSICPIFYIGNNTNKIEQIGSGIFFKTNKYSFLLTVSHIIDFLENGTLLVPCEDRLDSIEGSYSYLAIKDNASRYDDREEMAYFKLTRNFAKRLHNCFSFLTIDDIVIDNIFNYFFYTFSGYPYRKSYVKRGVATTELFNYTGVILNSDNYLNLGYDPTIHIVVNYRRNMTVNSKGEKYVPALPHGISGGGIFTWPQQYSSEIIPNNRRLIGIAHTYKQKENLLVGTNIIAFIQAILINNPDMDL